MRQPAIVVATVLACALAGCEHKKPAPPPPPTVFVSKPLQRKLVDWDDYVGRFEAIESVEVKPRVSGYLQAVHFRDGDYVRTGQLLFTIDQRPTRAALDQARAQLARAQATLVNARTELARSRALARSQAASVRERASSVRALTKVASDRASWARA